MRIRIRLLLLSLGILAAMLLAACAPAQKAGKDGAAGPAKLSAPALAAKAVADLGDEKRAFFAVLSAWDRGYSLKQIIKGIQDKKLLPDGVIDGPAPDGRPQRYLRTAGLQTIRLAASTLAGVKLSARPGAKLSIDEVIEARKAGWTSWLFGVIEKGYSVEQITMFMLEHDLPVEVPEHGIGPVITTAKDYDKGGKPRLGMDGKPLQRVVKPAFPPKGTLFNPIEVDSAEQLTSGLAKDFDDLISGKGNPKPASGEAKRATEPKAGGDGKFAPRAFRFKLQFMPGEKIKKITSSDVILRIDAAGKVTGSYKIELSQQQGKWTDAMVEDGTFEGQAVYPKVKGQMIRMDIDGTRHLKTTTTGSADGKAVTRERSFDATKMFQGVLAVDYSKGSGFLFGESAMYRWHID